VSELPLSEFTPVESPLFEFAPVESPPFESDLRGMGQAQAREYITAHLTTLKLTEKKHGELEEERAKWQSRIGLARSRGAEDLALGAEKEAARVEARRDALAQEIRELRSQIEIMRRQLPGLAARERSVDPDLLEQELLMATGLTPGSEEERQVERSLEDLERSAAVDADLAALKQRLQAN
jgi:phage shock protein A